MLNDHFITFNNRDPVLILNPCQVCDPNLDLSKFENPYNLETAQNLQNNLLNQVQVAYVDVKQQKRKREIKTKQDPSWVINNGHEQVIHARQTKTKRSLFSRNKKQNINEVQQSLESTDSQMPLNPDHLSELPWDSDRSGEELIEEELNEAINGNSHKSHDHNI